MNADQRPVAAVGMTQAHQQGELLAGRSLAARAAGLYAYAYRLTLSEADAGAVLRHAAVTVTTGSPRAVTGKAAFDAARSEVGRLSVSRAGDERTAPASSGRLEEALVRSGFHRRLHALPALQRQCWLLRHTGGHDVEAIAGFLQISSERVRSALASAARTLVEGELAEAEAAEQAVTAPSEKSPRDAGSSRRRPSGV